MRDCDFIVVGAGIVGLYLANKLSSRGSSVVVIEKGPIGRLATGPDIIFERRVNLGAVTARNHVVGGNSAYWGGALVPDDGALVRDLCTNLNDEKINAYSRKVYKTIGIGEGKRGSDNGILSFPVVTGRFRDLWSQRQSSFHVFDESELLSFSACEGANVASLSVKGNVSELRFKKIIVCCGMIDSHVVLDRVLNSKVDLNSLGFGRGVNDHLSFLVCKFPWSSSGLASHIFPPLFAERVTIGRRFESRLGDSGSTRWFFHIQAPFDEVEPYKTLKDFVFRRQRAIPFIRFPVLIFNLLRHSWKMFAIAFHRYFLGRLYYPEGGFVSLHVDIESSGDDSSLSVHGGVPYLSWDIGRSDIDNIRLASRTALALLTSDCARGSAAHTALVDAVMSLDGWPDEDIKSRCTEALHLGGGLQGVLSPTRGAGLKAEVPGQPLFVLSTAMFPRAGVANPVHTLLFCAEVLADELCDSQNVKNPA